MFRPLCHHLMATIPMFRSLCRHSMAPPITSTPPAAAVPNGSPSVYVFPVSSDTVAALIKNTLIEHRGNKDTPCLCYP